MSTTELVITDAHTTCDELVQESRPDDHPRQQAGTGARRGLEAACARQRLRAAVLDAARHTVGGLPARGRS